MLEGGSIGVNSLSCSSFLSVGISFILFSWENVGGVDAVGTDDVGVLFVVAFVGDNDVDVVVGIAVVRNGAGTVGGGDVVVDAFILLFGIKIVAFGDSWNEEIIVLFSFIFSACATSFHCWKAILVNCAFNLPGKIVEFLMICFCIAVSLILALTSISCLNVGFSVVSFSMGGVLVRSFPYFLSNCSSIRLNVSVLLYFMFKS
jgi:hypothetical protein